MPLFALQPTRASRDQSKDTRTVGVDLLGMIASGPVSEVHFERQATVEMGMPNGDRLVSRRRKLISTHMCVNAITAGRCRPKCATSARVKTRNSTLTAIRRTNHVPLCWRWTRVIASARKGFFLKPPSWNTKQVELSLPTSLRGTHRIAFVLSRWTNK